MEIDLLHLIDESVGELCLGSHKVHMVTYFDAFVCEQAEAVVIVSTSGSLQWSRSDQADYGRL